MKTLISILVCAMLALTVSSAEAQVTCSPGVPANICKDADPFFSGHHYTEASIRIEILTPNEFQKRYISYVKETSDQQLQQGNRALGTTTDGIFHLPHNGIFDPARVEEEVPVEMGDL
jgi:hypothetical protein